MSIPSGTTDFPLGHNFAITVGGRSFLLDAIDLPEKTTRVINRTNQNGDASDFQVREAGEKITGTATLQRLDTSTAPPKSGDSILWTTAESDESDYMLGYVTDVKVSRSKDSADVFEIGFLAEDFLETDYGIATGDFESSGADSFTADGNDGFTLGTGTGNSYGYIELSRIQVAGDTIVVDFDADLSGGGSPNLALRVDPTGVSGSFQTVVEGHNQMTFSVNSNLDWQYLTFGDGNANGTSYTISDFKIARTVAGLNSTKLVRLRNVGGLTSNQFFFAQGDLNGFAQTLDTTSGNGLIGTDSNYITIGRIKYDLGASAGTNKTIQFKVAYPSNKQISGTHDFTRFSNLSVLSTEIVGSFKYSIIQGDASITSRNSILIGLDLEDA
jgi:hypothetical protein